MSFNYVGLFAGCGGADSGFELEGYNSLGAFDNDRAALKVHDSNLKGPTFLADLTSFTWPSDILGRQVDVVFSGAPCQGFSTVGNRLLDDPRNNLLVRGGELAIELGARVFVSENVMGSVSGDFKKYWDTLELLFKEKGYNTQLTKVNCLDYGIAQTRKRILFFAWLGGAEKLVLPKTTTALKLKDVLEGVEGAPNNEMLSIDPSSHHYDISKSIKTNQKLCNVRGGDRSVPTWEIPDVFGRVTESEKKLLETMRGLRRKIRLRDFGDADPVELVDLNNVFGTDVRPELHGLVEKGFVKKVNGKRYDLTHTFNGKYRRLDWDKPSPTVDTRFGEFTYFLHPDEDRGFTVREAARIQGFADDFVFQGSLREQFRMIGNAVPPPLAQVVARAIFDQILI